MKDGLKHYLHYLMPKDNGFFTVSEFSAIEMVKGNGGFSGGNWVVPIAPNGDFFDKYQVDYVEIITFDMPSKMHTVAATRIGKDVFEMDLVSPMRFKKVTNGKKGKYIGSKFKNHDFHFDLVEVDFVFGALDELFKQKQYMVVGCQPYYHYKVNEDDSSTLEYITSLLKRFQ
jgi:hypothetical protein